MNHTLRRLLATVATGLVLAGTLGAGTTLAAPLPAAIGAATGAAEPALATGTGRCAAAWRAAREKPSIANLRAVGLCEIDRRLVSVGRLEAAVDRSTTLTDPHQAALDGILASTRSGLRGLRAEIKADATRAELRDDIRRIFEDFRVYLLVARQVWLVTAADTVDVAGARFTTAAIRLEAAIDTAEANGKDVGDARAHLAAMIASIDEAEAAVEGTAAAVLPLVPADWNLGEAEPVLRAARESAREARAALREALASARAIVADLR